MDHPHRDLNCHADWQDPSSGMDCRVVAPTQMVEVDMSAAQAQVLQDQPETERADAP
jgi:hypothetical protein